ncbi:MAG: hypothetical protein ACP5IX_03410, partial [Patescibacteria group bacterium]
MKTKFLIILIVLVGLSLSGILIYKNFFVSKIRTTEKRVENIPNVEENLPSVGEKSQKEEITGGASGYYKTAKQPHFGGGGNESTDFATMKELGIR